MEEKKYSKLDMDAAYSMGLEMGVAAAEAMVGLGPVEQRIIIDRLKERII